MPRVLQRALLALVVPTLLAVPAGSADGAHRHPIGPRVLPAKLRPNRPYTYRVENLPSRRSVGATDADVYASIDRSFRQWEAFVAGPLGITFHAVTADSRDRADITIRFGALPDSAEDDARSGIDCSRRCSDGDPSHIWLNDARTWAPTGTPGNGRGALELLVLHEIGHLLGLPHFHADKCEPLDLVQAKRDGDCVGTRSVMTRFLAVTLPGPFLMPIRCADLAALELAYGVDIPADRCADHIEIAPEFADSTVPQAGPTPLPWLRVLDVAGDPVRNVVVVFTVSAGEATGLIQVTDAMGVATLGSWVAPGIGATAAAQVPGLGGRVRFTMAASGVTIAAATSTPCADCSRGAEWAH